MVRVLAPKKRPYNFSGLQVIKMAFPDSSGGHIIPLYADLSGVADWKANDPPPNDDSADSDALSVGSDPGGWGSPGGPYDSDERLKEAIFALVKEDNLGRVLNLKAIRFKYKNQLNLPKGEQLGFIAQEVKEIIPELVKKDGGYFKLNYQGLIPILVEAIKELNEKFMRLEKELKS